MNDQKKHITWVVIIIMVVLVSSVTSAYASSYSHNSRFQGMSVHKGIDLSYHNGVVNWKAVKKSGVEFAIIRLGYRYSKDGKIHPDEQFENNYAGARKNGIKVGVYFFSLAKNLKEAEAEAKYTIKILNGRKLDLPVYYDLERFKRRNTFLYDGNHRKTLAKFANKFCGYIYRNGYYAGIYSCTDQLTNCIDMSAIDKKYYVWCGQYDNRCQYSGKYHIWQYSCTGNIKNVGTNIDMNFIYGKMSKMGNRSVNGLTKVKNIKKKARTKSTYTITWNKQKNAKKYKIYRTSEYGGKYRCIGKTSKNYFKDKKLNSGREYYYKVSAVNSKGTGTRSNRHKAVTLSKHDKVGVTRDEKAIRSGAGLSYRKLYDVPKGRSVVILSYTYDKNHNKWYKVRYKKGSHTYKGYMMHPMVKVFRKATTSKATALRTNAGDSKKKIGSIPKGKRLTIRSIKTMNHKRWYKVTYKKKTGWIRALDTKTIY